MSAVDLQVWMYPEELALAEPRVLARTVRELGFGAVSLALSYHQSIRIFPRYNAVRPGAPGGLPFDLAFAHGAGLGATSVRGAVGATVIRSFRAACDAEGIGFRAWLVALDNEQVALNNPQYAAQTLDGTPTMHALCPSQSAVREYAAALVDGVAREFSPDLVELEAALYPRWNGYVGQLALVPLTASARRYGAQCLCVACATALAVAGIDVEKAHAALAAAAGPPFGRECMDVDADLLTRLAGARDRGVADLIDAIRLTAPGGLRLRLLGSGPPEDMRLQGLGGSASEHAREVLISMADTRGDALVAGVREYMQAGLRGTLGIGMNWSSEHDGAEFVRSVLAVAGCGVTSFSFYNLSLVPEAGLETFAAAAAALAAMNDRQGA